MPRRLLQKLSNARRHAPNAPWRVLLVEERLEDVARLREREHAVELTAPPGDLDPLHKRPVGGDRVSSRLHERGMEDQILRLVDDQGRRLQPTLASLIVSATGGRVLGELLKLKFCSLQHVAEGFGFLGYHIFLNTSGGVTAVPREAAFEKLYKRLHAINAGALPEADKMASVHSWRCAYAAWEGGDHGDDVMIALLSNFFSTDLEEVLQRPPQGAKD